MAGEEDAAKPISLFYSYSHKDEELRNELGDHLVALERAGLIEVWHDREMLPGDTVDDEIARKLQTANLVLVLVSPSFIRSEYCYDTEMTKAIERHERGEARVVAVVLRPCQWQLTPLKPLLALPTDGKPVTEWPNRDTAFNDVAKAIAKLADKMRGMGRKAADPAAVGAKPAPRGRGVIPDLAVFRDIDAPWCPELVVLPKGEFVMGSPMEEEGRSNDEGPQHNVMIGYRFALGRYPVTVGAYRPFVEATGRSHTGGMYVWTGSEWKQDASKNWQDPGFDQTDRHPVLGISWKDAKAYVEWLAKETGKPYRLPSEAEWEYACRAGTTTPFSFGETITTNQANYDGNYTYGKGPKGEYLQRTTEVGSYPENPWGLFDMHGNVWEWVEDVWHDDYQGAPTDGSAWTEGKGTKSSRSRVVRGGSWNYFPRFLRSADRDVAGPDDRSDIIGFRVARTLD